MRCHHVLEVGSINNPSDGDETSQNSFEGTYLFLNILFIQFFLFNLYNFHIQFDDFVRALLLAFSP
jgi:hypothetical protein